MSQQSTVNILCFPYAGGAKNAYFDFKSKLIPGLNLLPFEPPGRGERFREPFLDNMEDVINDIFEQVRDHLHGRYAMYGHSFGAMISYLLTKKIIRMGLQPPVHLFLSGRVPPTWQDEGDKLYLLNKTEFWEGIKAYGGSQEKLFQYPHIMDMYEPIIRHDLQVLDSYRHLDRSPLPVPFSVLLGTNEKVTMEMAPDWQKESSLPIEIHQFEGNHFWFLNHIEAIVKIMGEKLLGQ